MRIYKRAEFMKLPAGAMFCKGKEWYFSDICSKDETIKTEGKDIDFYYAHYNWVDGDDCGECLERLGKMMDEGASFPMQDSISRDGMFDDTEIFLVFEKEDLLKLRDVIDQAIAMPING